MFLYHSHLEVVTFAHAALCAQKLRRQTIQRFSMASGTSSMTTSPKLPGHRKTVEEDFALLLAASLRTFARRAPP